MVERKSWHWPIGLHKTYDSSSNFWEPRCCPNWAKSCRRKPGNEAWASKASIEQTSKSLFWSSSHRPNGTKWLSESQVKQETKNEKKKKCCYPSQPVQKLPGAAIWSLRPGETDVCVFVIHHPTSSFAKLKAVETSTNMRSLRKGWKANW